MAGIDAAMAASLRASFLARRDIASDANNFKNAFSSWDNCMAATYCKWPVIALIIVGGLIVAAVVTCIVRCACWGMSCWCCCCRCIQCCGNCCGCCDPPGGRKQKHLDAPYFPPAQGYAMPPPMMAGAAGGFDPPKFAQFEVGPNGHAIDPSSKRVNADALPPMPSWDTASKKHVPNEEQEAVELGELDPVSGQRLPLMTGPAAISRTASPVATPIQGPYDDVNRQNRPDQYGNAAINPGRSGPYGQYNAVDGRGSNGGSNAGLYNRGYASQQPTSPQGYTDPVSPLSQRAGYNQPSPFSPQHDPYAQYPEEYNSMPTSVYPRSGPQRQFSSDSTAPMRPNPQRGYSDEYNRPLMGQATRGPTSPSAQYAPDNYPQRQFSPPNPYDSNPYSPSRDRLPSPPQVYNTDSYAPQRRMSPAPRGGYNNADRAESYIQQPQPRRGPASPGMFSAAPTYATEDPAILRQQQPPEPQYPGHVPYDGGARGPPRARGDGW